MNCFLEAVATMYLATRRRLVPEPLEEQVYNAQENLESCRKSMETREYQLSQSVIQLGREALGRRKAGDMDGARGKLLERRRACKRLKKLRSGLELVETQLEALKNSELDKEIMMSLRASTAAMKKAGVALDVQDAEQVMHELDDQMAQVHDITAVLSNPVSMEDDLDLEAELAWLEEGGQDTDIQAPTPASVPLDRVSVSVQPVKPSPAETDPPLRENLMSVAPS